MLDMPERSVCCAILVGRCDVERERPSKEVLRVFKDRVGVSFRRAMGAGEKSRLETGSVAEVCELVSRVSRTAIDRRRPKFGRSKGLTRCILGENELEILSW